MEWLARELLILSGPLYVFLQPIMIIRYRRRWRWAAAAPLIVMLPIVFWSAFLFANGHPGWPLLLLLAAPVACAYLLGVAVVKGFAT